MDIAKYIAQYLLKNKYCTIPGLGQLTIVASGATEKDGELIAGKYHVELSPVGAIDDGFPNFVAKAEQVSIAKSSNEISRFVAEIKQALQQGQEVIIPAIGQFVYQNNQQHFITNPNLQYIPKAIPVIKIATKAPEEKQPFEALSPEAFQNDPNKEAPKSTINWSKLLFTLLALAAVTFGGIYLFNYFNNLSAPVNKTSQEEEHNSGQNAAPLSTYTDSSAPLTSENKPTHEASATQETPSVTGQQVIINSYRSSSSADKRATKLKSYGNDVSVIQRDSTWLVVMPIAQTADSALLDSLGRLFNPKEGVRVLY